MNAHILPFPEPETPEAHNPSPLLLADAVARAGLQHLKGNPWLTALCYLLKHSNQHIDARDIIESIQPNNTMDEQGFIHVMSQFGYDVSHTPQEAAFHLWYTHHATSLYIASTTGNTHASALDCITAEPLPSVPLESPSHFIIRHSKESQQTEKAAAASSGYGWFRIMLLQFRNHYGALLGVSLILNIFGLITPLLVMVTYDRVVAAQAQQDLMYITAGFFFLIAVETILRHLRSRHIAWLGTHISTSSTHAIIQQLLRLPASMIERASVASQIARIKSLHEIHEFFTGPLFITCVELPFTCILLATLAYIAGPLAWIPIATTITYILIFCALRAHTKRVMFRAARSHSLLEQATLETFQHIESLRVGNMHEAWQRHIEKLSSQSTRATFHTSFLSALLENLAYACTALAGLVTLFIGVTHVLSASLSAGALIASMILVWRILAPIASICTMLPRIEQMRQSIKQLNRLMELPTERDRSPSDKARLICKGRISFTNVGIRYSRDTDPVFAGLTMHIKQGQTVAVMGGNGCGKSTVLKLILGLYQPQAGSVHIDDTDLRQFRSSDLRRTCTYIAQNPDFFSGTLADNMRIACPEATDSEILNALTEAGISLSADTLPEGIDTWLDCSSSDGTPTLFTYQINIARACLSKAPIILCDELPYGLVHDENGMDFPRLLRQWQPQRTVVFVTHREDLASMADIVVGLRSGRTPLVGEPDRIIPIIKEENYAAHSARAS